jgi:RNA polymerase sigma-70 factor (ECF subfamily)
MDGQCKIASYDGRAPLVLWLRVCAARLGMRVASRERRRVDVEEAAREAPALHVPDPELQYLRRHYGAQFRAAFADAVASLPRRDRNLLRHAVLDGLGIDQIAAMYHVHRSTAARQVKQARESLIHRTRERMRVALQIGPSELDSIFRVMMSMTFMTLRDVLDGRPC